MATITSTELGAVGRYVNLGSPAEHDNLTAQTAMAYMRIGAITAGTTQYLLAKAPDGAGPRLIVGRGPGGQYYFSFGASSSTAAAPNRASADNAIGVGVWTNICSTFNGGLASTGIIHYIDGAVVASYGASANGTIALTSDAANDICLLNRTSDFARSFVGDVAYVARWNRVLSASEVATAKTDGPLAVPDGRILLWANGQDYSPSALTPTSRTTHVDGALPPNTALGGSATHDLVASDLVVSSPVLGSPSLDLVHGVDALTASDLVVSAPVLGTPALSGPETEVVFVGDANNFKPSGTSVANADTDTPIITIAVRAQTVVDTGPWPGTSTSWRQFFGQIKNVTGKTPSFKVLTTNGIEISSARRPWYSYDLETWTQWSSAVISGSYLEFGGVTFTGDVYIALQPGWTVGKTAAYLGSIEAAKPSLVHELPSSGSDYIFTTLPAQTDELSRTVPAQPFYAFGIWDDTVNRDGGDKRAVVITCGIHPGEHVGHWLFKGFVDFLLSDDAKAVDLRKYYQFIVYPDINPLGKYGGHWRGQWDPDDLDKNANRDYSDYYGETPFSLNSSAALRDALAIDAVGRDIVCHLDFHGQQDVPTGKAPAYAFYQDTIDSTILSNTLSRLQAYNALYELKSTVSSSMLAGFMRDTYGCPYSFTPEAYERRVCTSGTADFTTTGAHFAQVLADSLEDMRADGAYPLYKTDELTAASLTVGAPALGTPALSENAPSVDALTAVGLVVGRPVLGTPALGQIHELDALGLAVGSPVLGMPALNGSDIVLITQAEVARIVRATSRMKTVTAAQRVKQVRYEATRS